MVKSKKCPNCGSIQVAIANYCSVCGAVLGTPNAAPQASLGRPRVFRKILVAIGLLAFFVCSLVLISASLGSRDGCQELYDDLAQYTLVKEKVYEKSRRFGLTRYFAVSEMPTEDELRADILKLYRSARCRRGPRYDNRPTSISILVYPTEEHARTSSHQIGQLDWRRSKEIPDIIIYEKVLAAFSQPPAPETRFGLSEDERKQVFDEIAKAEARALREAGDVLNALPIPVTSYDRDRQIKENNELWVELKEKYKNRLARKYGLTRDQLEKISVEGLEKYWAWYP